MLIDKLLQTDVNVLNEVPTGEIEIKRLSEKLGEPFIMKLKALKLRQYRDLIDFHSEEVVIEEFNDRKNKWQKTKEKQVKNEMDLLFAVILAGTVDPNFKDSRLQEKFHEPDPTRIIENLFNANELNEIATKITELSGVETMDQPKIDENIKN